MIVCPPKAIVVHQLRHAKPGYGLVKRAAQRPQAFGPRQGLDVWRAAVGAPQADLDASTGKPIGERHNRNCGAPIRQSDTCDAQQDLHRGASPP